MVLDADDDDLMVRFNEGRTQKVRSTYVRPIAKTA
jgi:hypothetical protein